MNISKKVFAAILVAVAVCSVTFGYGVRPLVLSHRDPQARANLYVLFETARSGNWHLDIGNVITNIGENYVRNIIGFDNVSSNNATKWISLSNDASPAASWTKLTNEVDNTNGFGRALGTVVAWMNGTDYAFNVTKKFTASGSATLQCAGLNWNPTLQSDNNLFACAAFSQTAFASGDNCTFTWVITFNAN